MPITAAQMMNNDVLAFYEEQDVTVKSVLSDNVLTPLSSLALA
jgi:hypothetical protein